MNNVCSAAVPTVQSTASFWARLLRDQSMQTLSDLERLVTGCEIIAALDDLELLRDFVE